MRISPQDGLEAQVTQVGEFTLVEDLLNSSQPSDINEELEVLTHDRAVRSVDAQEALPIGGDRAMEIDETAERLHRLGLTHTADALLSVAGVVRTYVMPHANRVSIFDERNMFSAPHDMAARRPRVYAELQLAGITEHHFGGTRLFGIGALLGARCVFVDPGDALLVRQFRPGQRLMHSIASMQIDHQLPARLPLEFTYHPEPSDRQTTLRANPYGRPYSW